MRILFVGAHFPRPNNRTIGTWALSQVAALRSAGHDIKVVSPVPAIPVWITKISGRGTSAVCPPRHAWGDIEARYVRWPVYPVGPLARWLRDSPGIFVKIAWQFSSSRFLTIAEQFAPDVIFAHHGQLGGFIAAEVARELDVPFFITEHNFSDIESCAGNHLRKRHYLDVTKSISSWIAVANRMRDTMQTIFPDVPARTIHNGAELIPIELRNTPRPPTLANRLVVLCATFFYKRKNVPLLVEAFDRVAETQPRALLLIIGDGEDKPAVTSAMDKATHRSQITLLGALGHRDVLQHMVWCDVFAQIGIDEPFATVFSEAMMAGKPIIFSKDGGITDVVTDGCHGLAVVPGDAQSASSALQRLLTDASLREKLGASAGQLANSRLTWENNAQAMTSLFQSAL